MNIINSTVLRNHLGDSLSEIATRNKDYLLVANRGKITGALVNIDLFEDLLALTNNSYLASIKQARQEFEQGDIATHQDVFGSL